ncbi:MAG: hypothetical protein AAF532_17160 [Planctomycetota bacterium]
MSNPTVIASRPLTFREPGKEPSPGCVEVFQPTAEDPNDPESAWYCDIRISAIRGGKPLRVFGVDSIQALALGLRMMRSQLELFDDYGGNSAWAFEEGDRCCLSEIARHDHEPDRQ